MNTDVIMIVFCCFAGLITVIIIATLLKDLFGGKKNQNVAQIQPIYFQAAMPAGATMATPIPQPASEPVKQPEPIVKEVIKEVVKEDDFSVKFNAIDHSLETKFNQLSHVDRGFYTSVRDYAAAIEGSRIFKNQSHEEVKLGKYRLVRLLIKRGVVQAELIVLNQEILGLMSKSDTEVKIAPTVMKIRSEEDVAAVKRTIDLAFASIVAEKDRKKELQKQKRKEGKA